MHPGEMGAAMGRVLTDAGYAVLWASEGRSAATAARAARAHLADVGTIADLLATADTLISICPPHAALDVARTARQSFRGLYVDMNAVSPRRAQEIGALFDKFVDGGIVGAPPTQAGSTRLFLSGSEAPRVAAWFQASIVAPVVVSAEPGAASAVKMAYAAWTKGTAALLLAIRAAARAHGVEAEVLDEWRRSLPDLEPRSVSAAWSAAAKGWRWVDEMRQVADTMNQAGLPEGFHQAAAQIFEQVPRQDVGAADRQQVLHSVLGMLGGGQGSAPQPMPSASSRRGAAAAPEQD